jgi:uncharacterized protein YjlB
MEKQKKVRIEEYKIKDDGVFPNSRLPLLIYKSALKLPYFFAGSRVKRLMASNNWKNSWKAGVFTYHHYHSLTHEVLAVIKGNTELLFGGDTGVVVKVEKGDLIIIPAGVAHKNLGKENDITVIGAYPGGREYDLNYGNAKERPEADQNIAAVPLPNTDPLYGKSGLLMSYWK